MRVLRVAAGTISGLGWLDFLSPIPRASAVAGPGSWRNAIKYGIGCTDEALACWKQPILGARLKECGGTVLGVTGRHSGRSTQRMHAEEHMTLNTTKDHLQLLADGSRPA